MPDEEKKVNFEKDMKTLDDMVDKIQSQELPLEECLKLYQDAQKLTNNLEDALKQAQDDVEKVINTKE